MAEISTDLKCHCGGAVVHDLQKVRLGDNGTIGPNSFVDYGFEQTFHCSDCGSVYVPTQKNGLKILPEDEANEAYIEASK